MPAPFLDSNILVYAFGDDPRGEIARRAMAQGFVTAVQALNEFANVAHRRLGMSWPDIARASRAIEDVAEPILATALDDHRLSLTLAHRYRLSLFDALMLAIALRAGCTRFFSEDMHHGLVVEERLTLLDPFRDGST